MIPIEDRVEAILCAVLPGDNQTDMGVQDLGLAVASIGPLPWAALRYRCLGDRTAAGQLWVALERIASRYQYESVRKRSGLLASLVLAEESAPPLMGKLSIEVMSEGLLNASRPLYYRRLREPHLALRARLDAWAREGLGRIAARLRG